MARLRAPYRRPPRWARLVRKLFTREELWGNSFDRSGYEMHIMYYGDSNMKPLIRSTMFLMEHPDVPDDDGRKKKAYKDLVDYYKKLKAERDQSSA